MKNYGYIIHRTWNNSYVITKNGHPYHVPNEGKYAEEWVEVQAYALAHPEYVTEEETYVPPLPTQEDLAAQVRAVRDTRLEACTWIVERHRDQLDAGKATTLTPDEYQAWLTYRQALRDLPQQPGFPWAGPDDPECPWPEEPKV